MKENKNIGRGFPTSQFTDELELTTLQLSFIENYFKYDKKMKEAAKATGLRSSQHGYGMLKSKRVAHAIAVREHLLVNYELATQKSDITREAKLNMLWEIAKDGVKLRLNKNGQEVMQNPSVSVSALHEMNLVQGHYSAAKLEVKAAAPQLSEEELKAKITKLVHLLDDNQHC